MIKRLLLIFLANIMILRVSACVFYDPDYEYYNLFMQELIDDPQYFPFLLTFDSRYYKTNLQPELTKIEKVSAINEDHG